MRLDYDWLGGAFRAVFRQRPVDPPELIKINEVAKRIDIRAQTIADAVTVISERMGV